MLNFSYNEKHLTFQMFEQIMTKSAQFPRNLELQRFKMNKLHALKFRYMVSYDTSLRNLNRSLLQNRPAL